MADAYSRRVRDHFEQPRNVGVLDAADAVGVAENPVSGASVTLYLALEGHRVVRAMFQAQGCAATIAACSVLTEILVGKTIVQVQNLSREDVLDALDGLPPTRRHAADLAIDVVRAAIGPCGAQISST